MNYYQITLIIFLLLGINLVSTFGQKIELVGGINTNDFFYFKKSDGHIYSTTGIGYSFGLAVDNINADWHKLRLTLNFDQHSGSFVVGKSHISNGITTRAEIDKALISIGIFPVNLKIVKRFDLNIGVLVSRLIFESYSGTSIGFDSTPANWTLDLQEEYKSYSAKMNFGLSTRLAYNLQIAESITITPQYLLYFGLTKEFTEFPEQAKSIRNFIGIGIKKGISTP